MFAKVILLAIAVQVCLASSDEMPGYPLAMASMFQPAPTAFYTCDGTSSGTGCKSCTVSLLCVGATEVPTDCVATSPTTPNCNNGACSATAAEGCETQAKPITCTGEGVYPDAKNCGIYHYCSASSSPSDIYTCATGYVFNAATGLCKRNGSASDCVVIKCPASSGYGSYGSSKTYYGYCVYSGTPPAVTDIYMFKCSTGATFDGSTCVYQCSKEGNFPNTNDSKTYYQCYVVSGKWKADLVSCPSGKKFDATKQICVA
ncbi:probable endochitinase [Topomyia yanbarensis]|uniref:probable endochitinase n=1 Tax=Topomyia yanbarensis TaxID=2498891 RepID=UPI00273AFDDC|nr:probable endochitinase [Topomyia yanbarensis]